MRADLLVQKDRSKKPTTGTFVTGPVRHET